MIWVVVILDIPSTAVSRIGRLVGVALIKCEFVLPTVICQLLYNDKPDFFISIFYNASMLLAAILDYLSMGEALPEAGSRNSDNPMTVLLTLLHGEMTRGLRNVSVPRDCVLK